MSTSVMQQISRAALVLTAGAVMAGSALAANQPFNATTGTVSVDKNVVVSAGATVTGLGADLYNSLTGTLSAPVASVSTLADPGPAVVNFGATDGFKVITILGSVSFTGFSFDTATDSLIGTIKGLGINYQHGAILKANTVSGVLGTDPLNMVSTSASSRSLYLSATDFVLSDDFAFYLNDNGFDASKLTAVSGVIKSVNIGAVPEPSTYAMMGMGLAVIGLGLRRRQSRFHSRFQSHPSA